MFKTAILLSSLTALAAGCAVAETPKPGSPAPGFTLADQTGTPHSLDGYRGGWVALAFYPKDMTGGCTVQNRNLTENLDRFAEAGVTILAASTDDVASHRKFCEKEGLRHTLLADVGGKVAEAYGVKTAAGRASRTTFLIDPKGRVAKVFENVNPSEDADEILAFVQDRQGAPKMSDPLVPADKQAPDFTLATVGDGKEVTLSKVKADKGVLLLFVSVQCPVSRGYEGRMNAIAEEMKDKGFVVFGINSNESESTEAVAQHAKGLKFPVLKDPGSKVADLYKAKVTPEAFLLSPQRVVLYHGWIDDSLAEDQITSRDLRDAMTAWLAGEPIKKAETRPFGCTIKRPR